MPEEPLYNVATTRLIDRLELNGNPSWLQATLDAPDAMSPFAQMMTGTWAITTTTAANTTAPNTTTATAPPQPNG